MKPFFLIRNAGLAPLESFTILGLSTARGEDDKIGQFGSGSKHGILALMRAGITPRIFIGTDELIFSQHPAKMGEKEYQEIRYTFQGEEHKTGMCLEFGALDWTSPAMALREFICNAMDQGENIAQATGFEDEAQPIEGETRVFVSTSLSEIRDYIEKLHSYFLHYTGDEKTPILPARAQNAQFFRRGVYVTERSGYQHPALFLYNFQDGKIDESRNMDGHGMSQIAARLLRKSTDHVETIFRSFKGTERWEHTIGGSMWNYFDKPTEVIAGAWKRVFGDLPFCAENITGLNLMRKGIAFAGVPSSWKYCLEHAGIIDGESLLNELDAAQADECEPTESAVETFQRVWRWLESVRLTEGKKFPKVKCFSQPMKDGGEKTGFYRDGTVFLNLEYDTNEQTALEELAHYITGAKDETRDFQDFAFKLATRLAKRGPALTGTTAPAPPLEPEPPSLSQTPAIRTAYFTFGQSHEHALAGKTYGRNDVIKITAYDPRARMFDLFGVKWAMEYDSLPKMEHFPNGITDLSPEADSI